MMTVPSTRREAIESNKGVLYGRYLTHEGKRVRFSLKLEDTKTNKLYAQRNLKALVQEHFEAKLENKTVVVVNDIAVLAITEDAHNRVAKDTTTTYLSLYEKFIKDDIGSLNVKQVKVSHINKIKSQCVDIGLSQSHYNKVHRVMNFIFKYAYLNELCVENVVAKTDRNSKGFKPPSKEKPIYTEDEMKIMFKAKVPEGFTYREKERFLFAQLFLIYGYTTLCRVGEIIPITYADIGNTIILNKSQRHGQLRNSLKAGNTNEIPLNGMLKVKLDEYKEFLGKKVSKYVFANPDTNKPFTDASGIRKRVKSFLKAVGIPYRTMIATRRSGASALAMKNVPIQVIQKQLSHASIETTMRYYLVNSIVSPEIQADSIALLMND